MGIYQKVKLILDFAFSLLLIIALSPLLLIVAVIIKLDSTGPVLFRQKRIGKACSEFYILKFRTMRSDTPKDMPTHLFQNVEQYITKSGAFLRKTSLDELPQLLNILCGQMSFIGPRPALWNQYDLIQARKDQCVRYGVDANSVKPGITGWAQVNGRDELPIETKADFDGFYAKNFSFFLDIKILVMTIVTIFTGRGISEGGPRP